MTDMPGFGILCCGRDIAELSKSVGCCSAVSTYLKESGYAPAGYHTALLSRGDKEKLRLCREKLYHLCKTCDLVLTLGGDGFASDDVIPELTANICDSEAVFFSINLSGAGSIGNYEQNRVQNRVYKRNKSVCTPTRSRAGCCGNSLILNFRNEISFIDTVLPTLLPSISFAVAGLSGKDPEESRKTREHLEVLCDEENGRKIASETGFFHFNSKITP